MLSKDSAPSAMMYTTFWMIPLLAFSMADTQALRQQSIAGSDIASAFTTTKARVSTLYQALVCEKTSATILI
jgi:hypothetical protein